MDQKLNNLYYDLSKPTAYVGSHLSLLQSLGKKFSAKNVENWLREQDAYNMHKRVRKNFQRRPYNVTNVNDLWEIDLMDLKSLKFYNDNYTYVLVVIDFLSKYAFAEPMKSKSAENVTKAFQAILNRSNGRLPITLQSDKGKEFVNKIFQDYLKTQNIIFWLVRCPDVKAACIERFIRTLKTRIWRYFTHKRTNRYIDVLQSFIQAYNNTTHSSIRMKLACVNLYNAVVAKTNLREFHDRIKKRKPRYRVGTFVLISRAPNIFRKGYERGWTKELFKITRVSTTRAPPIYFLEDLNGQSIDGFYYDEELSPAKKPNLEEDLFEIDEIIQTVGKEKKKKCLVSWKGYPPEFNSWIFADDIKKI